MKLEEAYKLLVEDGVGDNYRYFAELYKLYNFKEEDDLKDYIDFILHEPVHWMRGFPAKLTTKPSFAKPKTALIKLLKKSEVGAALGESYTDRAYDVIWKTFKTEHEAILGGRRTMTTATVEGRSASDSDVGDAESLESYDSLPPVPTVFQNAHKRRQRGSAATMQPMVDVLEVQANPTEERIAFLKTLLSKFAETMPSPAIADAFRLLVERV